MNPMNFFENRREQKGVKENIKKFLETFDFYMAELVNKGGLDRDGNQYGAFLRGLNEDKFILIRQMANNIKTDIEEIIGQNVDLSESVIKSLEDLKNICDGILEIKWQPHESRFDKNPPDTLTSEGNKNRTISQLLSDIYRPIHKLKTVDFPSILSDKIEVDIWHQ